MQIPEAISTPESRPSDAPRRWAWSPEVRAMMHPDRVYSDAAQATTGEKWLLLRRPLLLALFLGCTISLLTSGRLTLRLVVSGAITWSFVPLLEMASLALVFGRRRIRPFPQTVDLFFLGQGPWLCWLIAFGAFWAIDTAIGESLFWVWFWIGSAAAAGLWSAYLDLWFFRRVLRRTPARAVCELLMQRAIAWGVGVVYFGAGSLWPDLVGRLGR